MKKSYRQSRMIGLFSLIVFLFLSGCTPQSSETSAQSLTVTTSISPIADLIRQVGGDKVNVINLVPTGLDPHDFEPKPDDIRKVAQSSIFFANGAGEELYLDKLVQNAANPHLQTVVLSNGLNILDKSAGYPGNPHLWLDVKNAEHYVKTIRDSLIKVSPADSTYFQANADKYLNQLDELDQWIKVTIGEIPPEARQIIVFHEAWPYYANRYGLTILRSVVHSGEAEPEPKDYAELIQLIKQKHVRALFGEAGFNPKLVQQLAEDTGVKYVGNLYDDTLGNTPNSNSYLAMMRTNTQAIATALK
ncbi:MAG: metal ABC transporter substrate-binding protein [Desulfitobacteriaceae bacterium]|nr:metal ABC transporter substrate-binding protein [Desulfitobacteriaceae bacterium]MDI6914046.1 metal ABC transporter substrate-binding protein [Desulfitobacteriaceae bacterium]